MTRIRLVIPCASLCSVVLGAACIAPPHENLCGHRATAGGEIQDAKDCPDGYRCTFEAAPSSSSDYEWGVCRRATATDAMTPVDASVDGGVVDGAGDGGTVDGARPDAAGADLVGEDRASSDGGATDVAASDAVQPDGYVDPCLAATCAPATTCVDLHDGGVECRCGDAGSCGEAGVCVQDQSVDGGAVGCCPIGDALCGAQCVDMQDDETNCGGCGVACTGRDEGAQCIQGSCGCDVTADAGAASCPQGASEHLATASCVSVDGGALGQCTYTCTGRYQHCTGSDPKECETDTHTNDQHCGACTSKARQVVTVSSIEVLVSNRCEGGLPVCGATGTGSGVGCTAQANQAGGTGCYEPGAVQGAANATCEACWTAEAPLCGSRMCCEGACIDDTSASKAQHCGCDPLPTASNSSADCTQFDLGTTGSAGGKVCVNASGDEVTRAGLSGGSCGCNASGSVHCGTFSYQGANQSGTLTMAGVCSVSNFCVEQSVTSCGEYGGVTDPVGGFTAGAACHPLYGGPVCESPDGDGLGKCGCGTVASNPNIACQTPVTTDRKHVVASFCSGTNACRCEGETGVCDPASVLPDCCAPGGCTNLETDVDNCGTCGTQCSLAGATSVTCGEAVDGQCSCNGSVPTSCGALSGGGGGRTCLAGGCVCNQFDTGSGAQPCPVSTWCMNADPNAGQGFGCCESNLLTGKNRCPATSYPSCSSDPVLCVNTAVPGTKFKCCPTGSPCGVSGNDVSCNS